MTLIAIISVKCEGDPSIYNPVKALRANSPRNLEDGLLYFFKKEVNPKYNSIHKSNNSNYEIIDDYYQTELDVSHWYYTFLDKLDLQINYESVDKEFFLPESNIRIYDLQRTYYIKILVCPKDSKLATCKKIYMLPQSENKELTLIPYKELTFSESESIPSEDILEVLETPVYFYEDSNIRKKISETVHLKDIESLTEFRYHTLDISKAKMGIEEEEWTIGYGGGHSGPSYIKKGTRNVDVLNKFLQKVKADTIILPDHISRRHINIIIKNDYIKMAVVNEGCKLFSMHKGKLYNKKKTKLLMNPR